MRLAGATGILVTKANSLHSLHVTYIDKDGESRSFEVAEGDNLLDIAQANDLEMEGKHLPKETHTRPLT